MRVIHVSKVTGVAGSEGHLLKLLPSLAAHGITCEMAVLDDPARRAEPFVAACAEQSIPVVRVPIRHHLDLSVLSRLRSLFQARKPDIVHTHLLHADLYGLFAAQLARVPAAISSRHNDDKFRRNALLKLVNRSAMQRADRVIAISDALAHFVRQVEGIRADKVQRIHYGLDAPPPDAHHEIRLAGRAELGYLPDEPVVGMFGRLIEQKGVDVLLDAFAQARRHHPGAKLLLVGDGRDRATLEAQAARLSITDSVRFMGWLDHAAASRLMAICDVIAVPSRWEGFGLVTLEAMGWARPIIASRTSSLPEIVVEGETGRLIPPENPSALAAAITELLSDPEQARRLGEAGYRRLVEHFSVEKMVCATLELYQKVLDR